EAAVVETAVVRPMSQLFDADSKRLDEITDRITKAVAHAGGSADVALQGELKALKERVAGTASALVTYHDDKLVRVLKRHLAEVDEIRERYEAAGADDVSDINT